MQIKTIKNRLDNVKEFDAEVNTALADGWELTRRDVLKPIGQSPERYTYLMLYAELVKVDPPAKSEQFDPLAALRGVKEFCAKRPDGPDGFCRNCPLNRFCSDTDNEKRTPEEWELYELEVHPDDTAGA